MNLFISVLMTQKTFYIEFEGCRTMLQRMLLSQSRFAQCFQGHQVFFHINAYFSPMHILVDITMRSEMYNDMILQ